MMTSLFVSSPLWASSVKDIQEITCGYAMKPIEKICFGTLDQKYYSWIEYKSGETKYYQVAGLLETWSGGQGYDGFSTLTYLVRYSRIDSELKVVEETSLALGITHMEDFPDSEGRVFGPYEGGTYFEATLLEVAEIVKSGMFTSIPQL
jgi:hypothetical protein